MIELKNITKSYGSSNIFNGFSCTFCKDKITAVLGESGSGKTTLLKIIAGLTDYEGSVFGKSEKISFVFQEDRLIDSLTVLQNLKLVIKDYSDSELKLFLKEIGLTNRENDYIKNLSGGQKRRIAVLRALLYKSPLLLLDEPFINIDISLKYKIMDIIKKMQETNPRTTVFVSHDIKEAVYLSDRVLVLSNGKIVADIDELSGIKQKENAEKQILDILINKKIN